MLARIYCYFLFLFALPIFTAASAIPRTDPVSQCNTGSISCCNSVQSSSSTSVALLAGLLGIDLGSITGLVGCKYLLDFLQNESSRVSPIVNCSPLNIIGIGGNSCTAQPVCCTGNSFGGLINLGCSPINLNL